MSVGHWVAIHPWANTDDQRLSLSFRSADRDVRQPLIQNRA